MSDAPSVLTASFDPGDGSLLVTFDRPLAAGNAASGFEVLSQTTGRVYSPGDTMTYSPGSATMASTIPDAGVYGSDGDFFQWSGDDGPIVFQDGTSLSSIGLTPVTML